MYSNENGDEDINWGLSERKILCNQFTSRVIPQVTLATEYEGVAIQ